MTRTHRPEGRFTVVIPCAADKLAGTHAARDLYTSENFRGALAAAEALAADNDGQVLILSALYGLVELDERITAYNVKMGTGHDAEVTAEEIADQLVELDATGDLHCMLPNAYLAKADAAARTVGALVFDLYEGDKNIGEQRRVARVLRETAPAAPVEVFTGTLF